MPPRARAKPAHQHTSWASGNRRKPPPSGRRQPWPKRVKKRLGKELRKRPVLGLALQIAFAVLAVVLLVSGLLLENALFFLATGLSALGGVATRRAAFLEQERQMRAAGPKVSRPANTGPRKPQPDQQPTGAAAPPPSGGVIKCTDTSKPITDCGCSSRHVATDDGAKRYGKPIGSPIGRKTRQRSSGDTVKAS